jgi:hypothetical protein
MQYLEAGMYCLMEVDAVLDLEDDLVFDIWKIEVK